MTQLRRIENFQIFCQDKQFQKLTSIFKIRGKIRKRELITLLRKRKSFNSLLIFIFESKLLLVRNTYLRAIEILSMNLQQKMR